MEKELGLLINLSVSLGLALVLGLITERLRLSSIVGYLLAGIALGPQTPGFVADPKMAHDFAEIGVILLMFGVGLHFDLKSLLAVKRIALPGAIGQILVASVLARSPCSLGMLSVPSRNCPVLLRYLLRSVAYVSACGLHLFRLQGSGRGLLFHLFRKALRRSE